MSIPIRPPEMPIKMWYKLNAETAERDREEVEMLHTILEKIKSKESKEKEGLTLIINL